MKPAAVKKLIADSNAKAGQKLSKEGRIILSTEIRLINVKQSTLSKNCSSLLQAEVYIRGIEGSADRGTMRKYLKSQKLYKGS